MPLHRLIPGLVPPADSDVTGTKVGAGSSYFWRFHNCGALPSACEFLHLVVHQSGSRPRYVGYTVGQRFCHSSFVHHRLALWACGGGDRFFHVKSPDSAACVVFCRWPTRSREDGGFVAEVLTICASLGCRVCSDLA